MGWMTEFGPGYDVPSFVSFLVKKGLVYDLSWHNDIAPSFGVEDADAAINLRLWVEHPMQQMRDRGGKRFNVADDDYFEEYDELEDAVVSLIKQLKKYYKNDGPWGDDAKDIFGDWLTEYTAQLDKR